MEGASGGFQGEHPDDLSRDVARAAGSLFTGISTLCSAAVRLSGVDGAALAVLSNSTQARELVYATDAIAQQIDELQFVVGEGPCVDAYRGDRYQLWPDLALGAVAARWPAFTPDVLALGVRAAFAFPVPGVLRPIGVLELYRNTVGVLAAAEQESAAACAIAVGRTLHANWAERIDLAGSVETALDNAGLDNESAVADGDFSRAEVFNAAGMVAVQLAVPIGQGLDRLRAYSYAQRRSIADVAADIVSRRLSLRDQRDSTEGQQ
ncbi:GAF and ANTAR domain-containing protein [Nocardia ninae]|uniref:GAF domain-containing protein n=1 Tax=Nocardia ninae NBRC 108245 TaxID=1210091 RepID=A0A511MH22_9NOCA|nr:GAF and ANTAR domain-containing protein [Nocardia ninae]GEM39983.1 GAF domain-containing protein [Nocardia ninae NBRC 108245]